MFIVALICSVVNAQSVSKDQINNLAELCKIWGFLKYYHPEVVKGTYNWDSVLVNLIPKAKAGSDSETLILDLLAKIGDTKFVGTPAVKKDTLDTYVDWSWISKEIKDKILRENLIALSKLGNPTGNNKYVTDRMPDGYQLGFARYNEEEYAKNAYPSEEYRLLGLFRYWNIIQYYAPYRGMMDISWDKTLSDFIPDFINARDRLEYFLVVKRLAMRLNDGHAFAYSDLEAKVLGIYHIPFELMWVENNYVIGNPINDSLFQLTGLKKGDVVLSVHGRKIKERTKYFSNYVGGSNQAAIQKDIGPYLGSNPDSNSTIRVERNGKELELKIKLHTYRVIYQGNNSQQIWKRINQETGYVHMGLLKNPDTVAQLFNDLGSTKALILDFRYYPNFMVMYRFLTYVNEKNAPFSLFTSPRMTMPGYFWKNTTGFIFQPLQAQRYKGRLVLLVNEFAGSLGEFFPMALQLVTGTVTIGSQTWGADGNQVGFPMPGGISCGFSGLGLYYPDGSVCQRKGIKIDVIQKPTIKGLQEGRDELLERALEYLKNN